MDTSNPEKQAVRVTILSRPYTLRTSGDPKEVEAVAASVDELMLNIASRAPNADSTHIAVLACLHLADSLQALERDLSPTQGACGSQERRIRRHAGAVARFRWRTRDAPGVLFHCNGTFRGIHLSIRNRPWREQRVAALKADGGWLTVAGLFWLHDGPNTFGTDAANDIVLPAGPATPASSNSTRDTCASREGLPTAN